MKCPVYSNKRDCLWIKEILIPEPGLQKTSHEQKLVNEHSHCFCSKINEVKHIKNLPAVLLSSKIVEGGFLGCIDRKVLLPIFQHLLKTLKFTF